MTDPAENTLGSPEYPALHARADEASARTQRLHMHGVRAHLGLLLIVAAAGIAPSSDRTAAVVVAATMTIALVVQFALKLARHDDRWFAARALAENVKSAAWRYAMRESPADDSVEAADDAFLARLKEIEGRVPLATKDMALATEQNGRAITEWMRHARAASVGERLALLRACRIEDQRRWYAAKARENARAEETWTWATMAVEALAVVLAVVQIGVLLPISIGPLLATVAAALLAWRQTKRFSDLATAYRVAADDLTRLLEVGARVHDEAGLRRVVEQVEAAISREHSLWYEHRTRG